MPYYFRDAVRVTLLIGGVALTGEGSGVTGEAPSATGCEFASLVSSRPEIRPEFVIFSYMIYHRAHA